MATERTTRTERTERTDDPDAAPQTVRDPNPDPGKPVIKDAPAAPDESNDDD